MNDRTRKLLPVAIFGVLLAVAIVIRMNPPESQERRDFRGPVMTVETRATELVDYKVMLESYGTVQPRTRSVLVAQVAGQITAVDEKVRDGGFFEKGDVLVEIDARDYAADVRIAQATLADAQSTLAEAEARTNQAREDWARLGNEGDAPDLVLRIPQLDAARARVASAESALTKAQLDLERTRIVAPFAGRILKKFVDVGQVVPPNAQIAEIYATDYVEIRLPLRNRDLPYIELPESYRFVDTSGAGRVVIESDLIGEESWDAALVRTESAIDDVARQLHVIAQIEDPFGRDKEGRTPLKIGQYVTAKLGGRTLENAIVIPNNTIYQGTYVYTVTDGVLRRRDIDIAWQNDSEAVIGGGLEAGDQLVVTPLGQVTSGVRVQVLGEEGERSGGPRPRNAGQ
ncbi:MAG: efflux RND transporter periplasmic adaptor subunit [Gammaproteobacteria bacterium]|nr:efflux RND transporter periplasmic adaptor subunit [Gammaproteobacteria bacterium]NNF49685.1 efflux RND transporter periplasmic adaptor subunit [Woeseiaceae bacterium]MBT8095092.1 efflux RND transporter periplasmic adaptor subunit [Gammaproteobacteria bacterium]MBT8105412.1 efflux RND transporter periplasmic adaptor subunit [Gammaproteobacteria bacterium]NNK25426.1 efflux RND transporter periplasmic adaptor subunit [Woeseiaceae bacterium]